MSLSADVRLGNVLTRSVAIFRRRLLPIMLVTVVARSPVDAVAFLPRQPSGADAWGAPVFLGFLTAALAGGTVMYGVLQELRGERFSVGRSFAAMLPRLLPAMALSLCMTVSIISGLILFVVPGTVMACTWYVAVPACVAEGTAAFESMARSRALIAGCRWQVLIIFVLTVIAGVAVAAVERAVLAGFGAAAAVVAGWLGVTVIVAFSAVVNAVFYYELRVVREGIDIAKIASVFA